MEVVGEKVGNRTDTASPDRDDDNPGRVADRPSRGRVVVTKRRVAVRPSWNESRLASGAPRRANGEELPDRAIWDRARCSKPLTAVGDVLRMAVISAIVKPSTSRSTNTAVWRGDRCCSAAMNANSICSRRVYPPAGPSAASGSSSIRLSGYGWSQETSSRRVGSGGVNGGNGSGGWCRREVRRALRHLFVAMRYIHVRSDARPSNPPGKAHSPGTRTFERRAQVRPSFPP